MHRFKYTRLSKEQIGTRLKAAEGGPRSASTFSNVLNGKALKIVTADGPTQSQQHHLSFCTIRGVGRRCNFRFWAEITRLNWETNGMTRRTNDENLNDPFSVVA